MFRRSLFVHYMRPYTGRVLLNVLLRSLSAVFATVLVFAVAPLMSLLFSPGGVEVSGKAAESGATGGIANHLFAFIEQWVNLSVQTNGKPVTLALVVGSLFLCYFMKDFCAYMGVYSFIPIRNRMVADMRNDLFHRLMILPLSYYTKAEKGDLLTRISHNAQEVDNLMLNQIQQVMVDIITLIFLLVMLFLISVPLSLFVLVLIPLIGGLTGFISRSLRKKSRILQDSVGNISSQVTQTLEGIKTIRSYNASGHVLKKFKKYTDIFFKYNTRVYTRVYAATPLNEFLGTAAVVLVLIAGGYLIIHAQTLRPEVFIVYLVTMIQILPSSKNIITAFFTIRSGKGSLARIKEVLRADEVIMEKPDPVRVSDFNSGIEFKEVTFSYDSDGARSARPYPDERSESALVPVLENISLKIPKGKFIALVGPSGGGKSTLLNMIPRFFDPVSGWVLIDGQPLRDCKISDIRALSSLVSQDTLLFNDTIYNNILLGDPAATCEEVEEAARMADAHEFIMATEEGYNSGVGDGGNKLSGGQRQRISIARALVKKAPILLFDEATSALDTEAERRIMQAIMERGKAKGQTIVSIAHRLSSIRWADEIIVVDHGRIIGRGTHDELFANNALYRKLCLMQDCTLSDTDTGKDADAVQA